MYVPDWLPGTGWKATARKWREHKEAVVQSAYQEAKERYVSPLKLGNSRKAASMDMQKSGGERTIIGEMINQGPSVGLSEDEIDDYVQEIAFILLAGVSLISDLP